MGQSGTLHGNLRDTAVRWTQDALKEATPSEAELHKVEKLAEFLDARYRLFGIRFGYDSLIGLIPGVGDAVTTLLSSYVLYQAIRHRVPASTFARMTGNVLFDAMLGLVPLVGDIADIGFRANLRNAKLLRTHAQRRARERKD